MTCLYQSLAWVSARLDFACAPSAVLPYSPSRLVPLSILSYLDLCFAAEVCSRPGAPSHPRIEDFKCQEISNVLLAFARLSTYNTQVLQVCLLLKQATVSEWEKAV